MNLRIAAQHGIHLILYAVMDEIDFPIEPRPLQWWWRDFAETDQWELSLPYDYRPSLDDTQTIAHYIRWIIDHLGRVAAEADTSIREILIPESYVRIQEIRRLADAAAEAFDRRKYPLSTEILG